MEQISNGNPMLSPIEYPNIIRIEKRRYLHYFLLFLLIGISGIPFFYCNPAHHYLLIFLFFLSSILFLSEKNKFDKYFGIYLTTFIILCILQSIAIKYIDFISFLGLLFQIASAYFIVKIIGAKFIEYYVDLIVFFSIVSFIIFFPSLLFPQIQSFMIDKIAPLVRLPYDGPDMYKPFPYIILYTFNTSLTFQSDLPRNSGPFWEPGAFAGFIVVALIFSSIRNPNMWNKKK